MTVTIKDLEKAMETIEIFCKQFEEEAFKKFEEEAFKKAESVSSTEKAKLIKDIQTIGTIERYRSALQSFISKLNFK